MAQGKLPAFARLKEEGSFGRLRSVMPCDAAVTRTVLVTGKSPARNAVRSAGTWRLLGLGPGLEVVPLGFDLLGAPLILKESRGVSDRNALALWEIASLVGGSGVAAGWDLDLDRASRGGSPPDGVGADDASLLDLLGPEADHDQD